MVVPIEYYRKEMRRFMEKHSQYGEMVVHTGPLVDGTYCKSFCWDHGAEWWEDTKVVQEQTTVKVRGVECKATVSLLRIEYWSTDDSTSKYVYLPA